MLLYKVTVRLSISENTHWICCMDMEDEYVEHGYVAEYVEHGYVARYMAVDAPAEVM